MTGAFLSLLGGVGLFMVGMHMMTAALRDLASGRVRRVLSRAATTPLRGAIAGALVTALVQSSTAVTVAVIGFVGAGLLTFAQSVGIVLGANIGTTITGWIVALVGLKLHLGTLALPLIFVAALIGAFGRGRLARAGQALAGFALIFVGLDAMQEATSGIGGLLHADLLPSDTWGGRAALVLLGAAIVAVIQSSSAGVALALVFYSAQAISLPQAAALVIGADIGTTVTGLLAALGGSRAMLRTAAAHVSYNLLSGALAFLLLGFYGALAPRLFAPGDPAAVVAFHTGFNLLGVVLLLPFVRPFARFIVRLVPDRTDILPEPLDRRLLSASGAALDAATGASDRIATALLSAIADALRPGIGGVSLDPLLPRLPVALDDLGDFLSRIAVPEGDGRALARYSALLHRLDHLRRLAARAGQRGRIALMATDATLRRPACLLALAFAYHGADAPRLDRVARSVHARTRRLRRATLLREHIGRVAPQDVFAITDAIRWSERVAVHAERIAHYGAEARRLDDTP